MSRSLFERATEPQRLPPPCDHSRTETIYRGPHGCVEQCLRCNAALAWDADGNRLPDKP